MEYICLGLNFLKKFRIIFLKIFQNNLIFIVKEMSIPANIQEENKEEPHNNTLKCNTACFSLMGNSVSIRLNSPKTQQACLELGISPNLIQEKYSIFSSCFLKKINRNIDDFGGKTDVYEIKKLRYDHYKIKIFSKTYKIIIFETVLGLIKKILCKRKEIISIKTNNIEK